MTFSSYILSCNQTKIHLLYFKPFEESEFISELLPKEIERLHSFKSKSRKNEFVATRILRNKLFGLQPILYNDIGAPYIYNGPFISISHSKTCIGIAVNETHSIGLDLEIPRPNILDIVPKFISTSEQNEFDTQSKMEMTKLWSAKEAMYKLAGRKKIIFSDELILSKQSAEQWKGTIINHNHTLSLNLNIFELNNMIVSINSDEVVRHEDDL